MNNLMFYETSALNSNNVEEVFTNAAKDVYEGILTQRFDCDDQGNIIGVKPGNVELTAAQRNAAVRQRRASSQMF